MQYRHLCEQQGRTTAPIENIDKPKLDSIQDSWLRGLENLRRRGEPPREAHTVDELHDVYEDNAGLFVSAYRTSYLDRVRDARPPRVKLNGKVIEQAFRSLDEEGERGAGWSAFVEDYRAELPFEHVQDFDLVSSAMEDMDDEQREAITRFAWAWALQEAGYVLPHTIRLRISRDRKKTGLPLLLRRGKG